MIFNINLLLVNMYKAKTNKNFQNLIKFVLKKYFAQKETKRREHEKKQFKRIH